MFLSQAVADLQLLLAGVTTPERARDLVRDALTRSGLTREPRISEAELRQLLAAIAAEGGVAQEVAEQLAMRPALDKALTDTIEAASSGSEAASAGLADSKPGFSPGRSAV